MHDYETAGTGLKRIYRATIYSLQGVRAAWRHEVAFRQEVILALVLLPAVFFVGENGMERGLLAGSLLLVLIVELLNSGLEAVVDRIGPEHHALAGRAKDLGSAAVFLSLLNVVLVWMVVLLG